MKISADIPVIVDQNGWYETTGKVVFEWNDVSSKEGLEIVRKEITETLKILKADGELLPELKKLVKLIEQKKNQLKEVEAELKRRKRKVQILDAVLQQFGIEPEHYGVMMNLEKVAPAIEAATTKIDEDEENQIPFNNDNDDDDEDDDDNDE